MAGMPECNVSVIPSCYFRTTPRLRISSTPDAHHNTLAFNNNTRPHEGTIAPCSIFGLQGFGSNKTPKKASPKAKRAPTLNAWHYLPVTRGGGQKT